MIIGIIINNSYYLFIFYWYIKPYQKEISKKSEQLAIINRVSLEFHKSYVKKETLISILKELMDVTSAEGASLFIYNKNEKTYTLKYAAGLVSEKIIGMKIPEGKGLISKSVNSNKSLIVDDVKNDNSFYQKFDDLSGFETKSLICVPLIADDEIIGAFEVINKKGHETFDYHDLKLLETLSNLTSIAVRNTIKIEKIKN
jgi:sigma-B regulation protein RsbU (phosphoserine phosphatase)